MSVEQAHAVGATRHAPSRLHHNAYVTDDQEKTRHFYEDLLGMPLTQFWIEKTLINDIWHEYSHAFYGLSSGGALAFFCFDSPELRSFYKPKPQELFVHIALKTDRAAQEAICARLREAGYPVMEADHGYTFSAYVTDPNGMLVEFCVDPANVDEIDAMQRETAHDSLKRWTAGDRTPNNDIGHTEPAYVSVGHDG
jgi:catechol 2,3-dioxygenase-like lactoylglutathione lyase family enzyme